jgi:hypothetical protein
MSMPSHSFQQESEVQHCYESFRKPHFASEETRNGPVIQTNLNPPPRLPTGPILTIVLGFAPLNIASVVQLFRRLSKTY